MRALLVAMLVSSVAWADVATPSNGRGASAPRVLIAEWRKAENRATCAPIWLDDVVVGEKQIRARYFGGGWGVTVRNPRRWGVAGAGVVASAQDVAKWKFRRENAAGIRAGYGLEGFDMGPDWLAYVIVPGQGCLYNVWSSVGKEHLEHLIDHLRLVDMR